MMTSPLQKWTNRLLWQPISIAPLITFRILFGLLMMVGAVRFMASDWIEKLYGTPTFFFHYYGFDWVVVPTTFWCHVLYAVIAISALGIALGAFYRLSTIIFFLSFTYSELLDATNYLNHYYLVILLSLLLIFLPAHRNYSVDAWRTPQIRLRNIPAWCIHLVIFQLTVVYTFAGLAKINTDWLFSAMPMAVWLPERTHLPVLGYFFQFPETAFVFSWAGAIYDLSIAYFLMYRPTRPWAYIAVIIFHVLTHILFNIGLFPMIMISSTLIFFSAAWHERLLRKLPFFESQFYPKNPSNTVELSVWQTKKRKLIFPVLMIYILVQVLFPMRYLLYPSELFWSEEGYRFSWRVMLVEKHGIATFTVADSKTNRKTEIVNGNYLTLFQEKQMSIQPDFILQFAHFLAEEFRKKHGFIDPVVTVDAHVALNRRVSQRFINPNINLTKVHDSVLPKKWVLPFQISNK